MMTLNEWRRQHLFQAKEREAMQPYVVYCGQDACRESITGLLNQRNALLTAAKAYLSERDSPVRDTAMLELRRHELREAVAECEKDHD